MKEKVYTFGRAMLIACKNTSKRIKELENAFSKLENIKTPPSPNCSPFKQSNQ